MAIYMKVENGVTYGPSKIINPMIKGSVSQKAHGDWIALQSVKLPTEREGVNTAPGKVTDRTTSQVDFKDVEISKVMDMASPGLMMWNIAGATYKVTIDVCKEDGQLVLQITLYDTLLTNYDSDVSEDGKVEENLSLDYTKITLDFKTYDKANKPVNNDMVLYDLAGAGGTK